MGHAFHLEKGIWVELLHALSFYLPNSLADSLLKLSFVPFAHSNQGSLQHRASGILSREEEKQKKKWQKKLNQLLNFLH